jgi:hypothetical protein
MIDISAECKMDTDEAARLLEAALGAFRDETYEWLVGRIGEEPVCMERTGQDSTVYQLEISVVWDGRPGGDVQVLGAIDDGRWRAFVPLTRGFIKAPDGSFRGE